MNENKYKYKLDLVLEDLGIGVGVPFVVDDNAFFSNLEYWNDIKLLKNTKFLVDGSGSVLRFNQEDEEWQSIHPLQLDLANMLALSGYDAKYKPVCLHCLEESDELFTVFVDYQGTTELWCRECMDSCTWSCSKCFDPFDSELEYDLNSDYEYICKHCHKEV